MSLPSVARKFEFPRNIKNTKRSAGTPAFTIESEISFRRSLTSIRFYRLRVPEANVDTRALAILT